MLTIAFTGDVCFGNRSTGSGKERKTFASEIITALQPCDYTVFNIEGPITLAPPDKKSGLVVESSPAALGVLESLHCNVFNLANNHIFDHGLQGYRDTVEAAKQRGWLWLGAGETLQEASTPLILRKEDFAVGLISVCREEGILTAKRNTAGVFCDTSKAVLQQRIHALKKQCDQVGIIYHGGEEIYHFPTPARRRQLLGYLEAGADFVVAHHAHVVQGYEALGEKYVFYGLGDFSFDFNFSTPGPSIDESVLLVLQFQKGEPLKFTPVFTHDDRIQGHVCAKSDNPWFREIRDERYREDYANYARETLRQWMIIKGNPQPSLLRRLRRAVGLGLRITNRYQRPILLAGVRAILSNIFQRR